MYFDLDNPERGPFVASGDEGFIADHTYVCRDEVMEDVWAQLITWRQPISQDQADAIATRTEQTGARQAPLTGPPATTDTAFSSAVAVQSPGESSQSPHGRGGAPMRGTIAEIVIDRGFGFVDGEDGRRYFFHRNALTGADFGELGPGVEVEFAVKEHDVGDEAGERPRAINLRLAEGAIPAADHEPLTRGKVGGTTG
jgi:cold shock CspA family protein